MNVMHIRKGGKIALFIDDMVRHLGNIFKSIDVLLEIITDEVASYKQKNV